MDYSRLQQTRSGEVQSASEGRQTSEESLRTGKLVTYAFSRWRPKPCIDREIKLTCQLVSPESPVILMRC